ncbi:hypothetical protein HDU80_010702 [Chytriomyces hyalinus]|nr:hypothetical protein HDU80_010702 [Chytriomyces hyalinus]
MLNWVLFWTRSPSSTATPTVNSSDDAWELVGSGSGPVDADVKLSTSPKTTLGVGLENGLRARTMLAHAQHRAEDCAESSDPAVRVAQMDNSEDTVDEDIDDADDALEDFTDALRRKGTHAYMSRKARRRLKKDAARALNKARASS